MKFLNATNDFFLTFNNRENVILMDNLSLCLYRQSNVVVFLPKKIVKNMISG